MRPGVFASRFRLNHAEDFTSPSSQDHGWSVQQSLVSPAADLTGGGSARSAASVSGDRSADCPAPPSANAWELSAGSGWYQPARHFPAIDQRVPVIAIGWCAWRITSHAMNRAGIIEFRRTIMMKPRLLCAMCDCLGSLTSTPLHAQK